MHCQEYKLDKQTCLTVGLLLYFFISLYQMIPLVLQKVKFTLS